MNFDMTMTTSRELYFSFTLASNSLGANQYVTVDFGTWTIDAATSGNVICKYKVGSNLYWVPAVFTLVSGNIYKIGVYSNQSTYSMPAGSKIIVRIDHINPDAYHGVLIT
jgi:hypothetical protein